MLKPWQLTMSSPSEQETAVSPCAAEQAALAEEQGEAEARRLSDELNPVYASQLAPLSVTRC